MAGTLEKAFGYQGDNLNLPVADLESALPFYEQLLGFRLAQRSDSPVRSALLERDRIQIRLAENGGDPAQDGCAFHVCGVNELQAEFRANGLTKEVSDFRTENREGSPWLVFFVVAPDGLCFWFGEKQDAE